jgi:hypothetical protein
MPTEGHNMKTTELCNFNDRIIRKDELERAQKECFTVFKVLFKHLSGGTKESNKVSGLRPKI